MADIDLGQVSLLQAIVNDEAHKERMASLIAKLREVAEAEATAKAHHDGAERALQEAQAERMQAQAIAGQHDMREASIADHEERLSAVSIGIEADKKAWLAQRAEVDAAQEARHHDQDEREANIQREFSRQIVEGERLKKWEDDLAVREATFSRRNIAIEQALRVT